MAGKPSSEALGRGAMNWLGLAVPSPAWAAQVFPDLPAEEQQSALWEAIFKVLRLNEPDPVASWRSHIDQLVARCHTLSEKQYDALSFTGPGTDLTIGLVPTHYVLYVKPGSVGKSYVCEKIISLFFTHSVHLGDILGNVCSTNFPITVMQTKSNHTPSVLYRVQKIFFTLAFNNHC